MSFNPKSPRKKRHILIGGVAAILAVAIGVGNADLAQASVPDNQTTHVGSFDIGESWGTDIAASYSETVSNLGANAAVPSWDGGLQTQNGGNGEITLTLRSSDRQEVTLFFRPSNLYLVAIQRPSDPYPIYFNDDTPTGISFSLMGFGGNYNALTQAAGRGRSAMPISWSDAQGSIAQLATAQYLPARGSFSDSRATARSLLFIVQMFSEAARFPRIQTIFRRAMAFNEFHNGLTPGEEHLENNWSAISSYSYSLHHGQSPRPLVIGGSNGSTFATINNQRAVRQWVNILLGRTAGMGFDPGRSEL